MVLNIYPYLTIWKRIKEKNNMGKLVDDRAEQQDHMKQGKGIGLYKIRYQMDIKGNSKERGYMAGVIAYTSREAIDTLVNFAKVRVKGFKGLKHFLKVFNYNLNILLHPLKVICLPEILACVSL